MKKFVLILLAALMVANPALAKKKGFGHRHRHYSRYYASDVAAGIVGSAVGVMIAGEIMGAKKHRHHPKPRVYIVEPEAKCYTIVSRKTGKIKQECVDNAAGDIIYVD